jgi:hypothetical protein
MTPRPDDEDSRSTRRARWDRLHVLIGTSLLLAGVAIAQFVVAVGSALKMGVLQPLLSASTVGLALVLVGSRMLWDARPTEPEIPAERAPRRGRRWTTRSVGLLIYIAGFTTSSFFGQIGRELHLSAWVVIPATVLTLLGLALAGWLMITDDGPEGDDASKPAQQNSKRGDVARKEHDMQRDLENGRNRFVGRTASLVREIAWMRDALAEIREQDPEYVGTTGDLIDAKLQAAGQTLRQVAGLAAQFDIGNAAEYEAAALRPPEKAP